MIKDRPPRLDEIFQVYDAPLFFVTICTIHRQKIADLETVPSSVPRIFYSSIQRLWRLGWTIRNYA